MDREVNIPWGGGRYTMGRKLDIPWIGVSKCQGKGGQNTRSRGSIYHG